MKYCQKRSLKKFLKVKDYKWVYAMNLDLTKECECMKKNKGIAILLFAILLQMCSSGMELVTLAVGVVGLVIAITDDGKKNW